MTYLNQHSTLLPLFDHFVKNTDGPIIELGMGSTSTRYFYEMCPERDLTSLELEPQWIAQLEKYTCPNHRIREVPADEWLLCPEYTDKQYDLALVDQHPSPTRGPSVLKIRDNVKFIICHDSENIAPYNYHVAFDAFPFKYEFVYRGMFNGKTMLLSDHPEEAQAILDKFDEALANEMVGEDFTTHPEELFH